MTDDVAVQGAVQRTRRKKEVFPLLAQQKGKAAAAALHRAFDKPQPFGRNVSAALVAHDLALFFHLRQDARERLAPAAGRNDEQAADL